MIRVILIVFLLAGCGTIHTHDILAEDHAAKRAHLLKRPGDYESWDTGRAGGRFLFVDERILTGNSPGAGRQYCRVYERYYANSYREIRDYIVYCRRKSGWYVYKTTKDVEYWWYEDKRDNIYAE